MTQSLVRSPFASAIAVLAAPVLVLLATISVARSDDGHDHDSLEQRKHVHGAATFNVDRKSVV